MKLVAALLLAITPSIAAADRPREPAGELRRVLVARFDANGDGQLGPRERMRAIRALERVQRALARGGQQQGKRKLIERFDTNHDGDVGPGEMPPAAARRLRPLDRDRDGWIEPHERR